jgi:hypothetical protein
MRAASGIGVLNFFVVEVPELAGRIHVDPASVAQPDHEPTKRPPVFVLNELLPHGLSDVFMRAVRFYRAVALTA